MTLRDRVEPGTSRTRLVTLILVAAFAAITLGGTLIVAPARAASDQLRLAVATTYRVDPVKATVHVTMDITATSLAANGATTIYFFNSITFSVQSEARSFVATSNGSPLSVSSKARTGFRSVVTRIPNLYYQQTRKIRLTFDLPGGVPRSDSRVRVGLGHVEFVAWAHGDPGLSDVTIVSATGFESSVDEQAPGSISMIRTAAAGKTTFSAHAIVDPGGWYAVFVADRASSLTSARLALAGHSVTIHAWPEDKAWLQHVSGELTTALPRLESAIGLPWPVTGDLAIYEVASSTIDGYGGIFSGDTIQITEDVDDQVIVHEASHAWFNQDLFAERWITEGLADEYASRVVAATTSKAPAAPPAVSRTNAVAFPLNAWGPPTKFDDSTVKIEDYGYDASWTVMRQIVTDVTEPKMRAVFAAADASQIAYVGTGPAEKAGTISWRTFLDYLEEIGGSTAATGVIRTWVATPSDVADLATRDVARTTYATLVAHGNGWVPGYVIRSPMSRWNFNEASKEMTEAETVLADRNALVAATSELQLPVAPSLEAAYDSATTAKDLTALDAEVQAWTATSAELRADRDGLAAARSELTQIGLLGEPTLPEDRYAAALAAFRSGDRAGAVDGSMAAVALLAGAEEIGRTRVITAGVVSLVVLVVLLVLLALLWRGLRRRRRGRALVSTVAVGDPGYATLAATSDPTAPVEVGEDGARGAEPD